MAEKAQVDFSLKETSPNIGRGRISGSEKLTSSFDLVEQMQFLYVKVVKARNLGLNKEKGNCDPFVEVKIGNYKGVTKLLEKKPNPEWNEVFAFTKDRLQGTEVEICVNEKKLVNNEYIGKYTFNIFEVPLRVPPDSPLAPQWYRLEDKDGKKIAGEIMLSVWVGTQADEVFPDAWHSDAATVSGESIINTRSKVYMSRKLWYLRVNIIQAQDLVPGQKNRNPEVYIKAVLGSLVLRSRVSPSKSVNPTWNEDLMFVAVEPFDDALLLSVEDKLGGNKEECIGRCEVKLSQVERRILPVPAPALWYNLDLVVEGGDGKKEVKFAGRLHMRVSLDGGYHVFDESIHYISDYRASAKLLWTPMIGVLELGILSANGLLPMKSRDGRGTTDAYCVAKYGHKWIRTRTIVDSFSPQWNEQYTWEVYDPYTVITIGVFDNCHLQGGNNSATAKDPRIGKVRIRLSTLETDRIYTHSYPLIVLQPNGVKKMGEIQLAVRFTCSSMFDMLQAYMQPLLPTMHYVQPLSVYQLDSLRHQANHIVSLQLARNEPPLRKEVVEYMLDVGSHMWSLRRGRTNFERLLTFFKGFVEAWKWFDKIKKWESPFATILTHVIFLILVFFPHRVLPVVFLWCFLAGILGYRRRQRHPPQIDIKMCNAESVQADELDEEFDTFPSSKKGDVLRMRYDRLRGIAGRMMTVLGDLAMQGERFQSLLSWRDPRATSVFVIFSLVACILLFLIPLRTLIIAHGFYAMRHPRLRINIPSIPQNFFRRLPTRADSML